MLEPKKFQELYEKRWTQEFANVSNEFLRDSWETLAKAFNSCITLNQHNQSQRIVVPMPTGSGKSTGLELYLQHLGKKITALVVVYFTKTADELVENINKLKPNTAATYHSKNNSRLEDMQNTQILVVTHQHFIMRMNQEHIDRDLIVVDEAIDLLKENRITKNNISRLEQIATAKRNFYPELDDDIKTLQGFNSLIDACYKQIQSLNKQASKYDIEMTNSEFLVDNTNISLLIKLSNLKEIIKKNDCASILIGRKLSFEGEQEVKTDLLDTIDNIESFLYQWFYYYGTNIETASINTATIHLPKKTFVVLDATATTNYLYELFDDVYTYPINTKSRNYSNVVLNVARGIKTGKSSMCGKDDYDSETKELTAQDLFDNLSQTSVNKDNKVLIVTHKTLEPFIHKFDAKFHYDVAHFGALTGKNDWKDYDTVVVYGLMHKPKEYTLNRHAVSVNVDDAIKRDDNSQKVHELIKNTDLAAEVIQAINRVRCRSVIDELGNCKATNIYITLPNGILGDTIIDEITSKMNNIVVKKWNFDTNNLTRTSSKKSSHFDSVLSFIKNNIASYDVCLEFKTVRETLNISKSTFNDLAKSTNFIGALEAQNISINKSTNDGRQKAFYKNS